MQRLRPLLLTAIAAASGPVQAAEADWLLCPPMPAPPSVDVARPDEPGVTRAAAEQAQTQGDTTVLQGSATLRQQTRTFGARRIRLHRAQQRAEASGDVFMHQGDLVIEGERGEVDLDSGAFTLDGASYRARRLHVQGRATRVTRDEVGVSRLNEATYSTCPASVEDWHLAADSIRLNPNTRQGTARNATLWFQGVPLMYTPWFRFPLGDERMSGLLAPSFGSSSSSGFTFGIPYYWNAAPNFDATLEPRVLAKRGFQLRTEWRWLGPLGLWRLNNEYLPSDNEYGDDRTLTRIEQHANFGADWSTDIEAATASDPDYFDDLSTDLSLSSQTHLRRRADLRWNGQPGRLRARVETYQTLDQTIAPDNRPYDQVPQITFNGDQRYNAFELDYDSELVSFDRDNSTTGTRFNLNPALTWNLETPGWYLHPRLAWDYTAYDLNRMTDTGASHPDRSLPILSLDSGLVFERLGDAFRQTLEPRAFYVRIPEEDQDDLPVFDTDEYQFSFAQLFQERRFTGPDRLGDTNRLTLALTTRLLDRDSGREFLRASVGSIHYFDDRTVQLPNRPDETRSRSDLAGEFVLQPTEAWRTSLDVRWNPRADRIEEGSVGARYDGGDNRIVDLGYRFTRDDKEAIDLAAAWPLSPRWLAVASTRYSLRESRNFETLVGAEYDSCCWKLRTVIRRYANDDSQDTGVFIELVLKGLGGVGDDAGGLLDRAILGYSR